MSDSPFESIESAHEYVDLLVHQADVVRNDLQADIAEATEARDARRMEALQIVDYKLAQLGRHLTASRRILNDLQMLRRLLVGEAEP